MSKYLELLLNLVFPPRCIFCADVVPIGEAACPECVPGLHRMRGDLCAVCGKGPADCVCTPAGFAFCRCIMPFAYDGAVRNGILDLKRSHKSAAAAFFGKEISRLVKSEFAGVRFSFVTYVPAAEGSERGFNPAALLAEIIAGELRVPPAEPPILKLPGSPPQHTQSLSGRLANAEASYRPARGALACGTALLVDDVMTTGATLNRCSELLRAAGATGVYCAAAAGALRRDIAGRYAGSPAEGTNTAERSSYAGI